MSTTPLANYIAHRNAFADLLQQDIDKRILTFCGESGTGKTHLLTSCTEYIPSGIKSVDFNCKGAVNIAEFFYRTGYTLNWETFPCFLNQVNDLSSMAHVQVDRNWLIGINNRISVALHADSSIDREERRAVLTDAWFEDIHALNTILLISIDTYEQATAEMAGWVSGPFLFRAARSRNLRVLIAGQQVPDEREHASEWGRFSNNFKLYGVSDAEPWLPVIAALGRVVPSPDPLVFMAGICLALEGRPADIMNIIQGFPRQTGMA